jgi:hypothetical protein
MNTRHLNTPPGRVLGRAPLASRAFPQAQGLRELQELHPPRKRRPARHPGPRRTLGTAGVGFGPGPDVSLFRAEPGESNRCREDPHFPPGRRQARLFCRCPCEQEPTAGTLERATASTRDQRPGDHWFIRHPPRLFPCSVCLLLISTNEIALEARERDFVFSSEKDGTDKTNLNPKLNGTL